MEKKDVKLVGGFNHLEKSGSQWEGLSHILWTLKNMFEATNRRKKRSTLQGIEPGFPLQSLSVETLQGLGQDLEKIRWPWVKMEDRCGTTDVDV